MPSSNKTGHLYLNKWLGSDKPKKDDFNNDNAIIDSACKLMAHNITILNQGQEAIKQTTSQLESNNHAISQNLTSHGANTTCHITAAERTRWNNASSGSPDSMVIGTYIGTGANVLQVNMGFRPKFGLLYCAGAGPVECDWGGERTNVYSGVFSSAGCSKNISITSSGISVSHQEICPMDGTMYSLNKAGATYIYVAWKE